MTRTSALLCGTPWPNFAYALTCVGLMHLGCAGVSVDNSGTGVAGSVGTSGTGTGGIGTGGIGTGGASSSVCFSPTQNLSVAYQSGAKGCACSSATDASVCVQGVALICMSEVWIAVEDGPCMPMPGTGGTGGVATGGVATGGVATGGIATGGVATGGVATGSVATGSVATGSVATGGVATGSVAAAGATAAPCFTPTQNVQLAKPGATGCACHGESSVCVNGVGLICMDNYWTGVWDGPCMPNRNTGGASSGGTNGGRTGGASGIGAGGSGTGGATLVTKRCGARAGDTCSAAEYCAYKDGEYCGAADAESVCKARPQACGDVYAPVCGCDRKSYENSCQAAVAGVGVYANGSCPT